VVFFRTLAPDAQVRFRRELQTFIGEKQITGIKTTIDTRTLVLAAASAVIPIFGYPEWEWDQISEILIYPDRFGPDFNLEGGGQNTLGMVGTGSLNRIMILSKPDLIQGFKNPGDKRNVGLHEFAHLVDKSDGVIDGIPAVGLDQQTIGPWIELVHRKMAEIEAGKSDLNPYALTNEAEPGPARPVAIHPAGHQTPTQTVRAQFALSVREWAQVQEMLSEQDVTDKTTFREA